jgi:Flp pilus assembly protein TadG
VTAALFHRLRSNQDGATIIEFALIAPTLLVMLFGLLDLSHNMYTAQMLQGAIQQAARNSTIEGAGGREAALDGLVDQAVQVVAPGATVSFSRKSYSNFTQASRPEDYTDVNANGTCDNNEPYEDANGNGNWDLDPGQSGFGSARDAVLYTVTVNYQRFFPVYAFLPGQTDTMTMTTSTVLRNQPYGAQANSGPPATGNCT